MVNIYFHIILILKVGTTNQCINNAMEELLLVHIILFLKLIARVLKRTEVLEFPIYQRRWEKILDSLLDRLKNKKQGIQSCLNFMVHLNTLVFRNLTWLKKNTYKAIIQLQKLLLFKLQLFKKILLKIKKDKFNWKRYKNLL